MNADKEQKKDFQVAKSLEAFNVFEEFSKGALVEMAAKMNPVTLKEGEVLFSQGDDGEAMYIVIEGRLRVTVEPQNGRKIVVMDIGPGVPVGEISLLIGGRRNSTVFAVRDTELAELTKDHFENIIAKYPEIRVQLLKVVLNRLRRSLLARVLPEYFGEMNEATFNYIDSQFEWVHIKRGQSLFKKGESADSLYILINGLLNVVAEEKDKPDRLIGVISWSEIVGEMAILSDGKRTASIYAARDSDLVKLSRTSFERISERYPQVMMAIMRILIYRLNKQDKRSHKKNIAINIAVLPTAPNIPLVKFTERLMASLTNIGPTFLLTPDSINTFFKKKDIAQTPEDDPRSPGLSAWLTEIESINSFVIYRADYALSPWTRRCLSRADKILLLADAKASPTPGIIEREYLGKNEHSISSGKVLVLLHRDCNHIPKGTAAWLDQREVHRHYHIRWEYEEDFDRLARILGERAVGLALGGGIAKGIAHIGVIRALEKAGIPIDMIGGTSMGAVIGAMYAMGGTYEEMLEMSRKLFVEINPFNEYTLPIISLLKSRKIELMGRIAYGSTDIEDLWINFFCVSTNLTTTNLKVFRRGPLWKAVRASSALPGVVTPLLKDGQVYVDGGVINNLPGDVIRRQCGVVIVSEASPNINLSFQIDKLPSPWKVFWSRVLPFKSPIKVPTILDLMMSTMLTGSILAADSVKEDADLILTPPVKGVGFLDFKKMEQTAEIGYRYTMETLENLDSQTKKKLLIE